MFHSPSSGTVRNHALVLLTTGLFWASGISLLAQGSLTPPGAPAPTMKTLDQVEARTPISSLPFPINNPGSYYLTKNLNVASGDAITINANQVTIDLNGFTISSTATPAAGTGVVLGNDITDITILNGHIKGDVFYNGSTYSGSGFANGISYFGPSPGTCNVRVAGVSVSGCLTNGIYLNYLCAGLVESCTVRTIGGYGILSPTVSHSSAADCGDIAIYGLTVSDCSSAATGSGFGLYASSASNCYASSYSGTALHANNASNCYGSSSSGIGIDANNASNSYGSSGGNGQGINASTATGCYGRSNSSQGIFATNASNCYGVSESNRGVFATVAMACTGVSNGSSYGVFASKIANNCYGFSNAGTGLNAYIAIGCVGETNIGGLVTYTYHYNMPP